VRSEPGAWRVSLGSPAGFEQRTLGLMKRLDRIADASTTAKPIVPLGGEHPLWRSSSRTSESNA